MVTTSACITFLPGVLQGRSFVGTLTRRTPSTDAWENHLEKWREVGERGIRFHSEEAIRKKHHKK